MLSHFIERAGVPTVGISLVREHTEQLRPPRALWVPFELGRPLGAANDPGFQMDVLRSALRLLAEPEGPVLADYPHDAPAASEEDGPWACALPMPAPPPPESAVEELVRQLDAEMALLRPWYEEGRRASGGRTAIGVSGLTSDGLGQAAAVFAAIAAGEPEPEPELDGATVEMPLLLRYLADDLKAYYFEAAAAQPGGRRPASQDLNRWLFGETVLGDVLYRARDVLLESDDRARQGAARLLIPGTFNRRPSREQT